MTSKQKIVGSTLINTEGIKKHFKTVEPWKAIAELVWNGFDAGATAVNVQLHENDLNSVVRITVIDNGSGIDLSSHEDTFGRFNDSRKKNDENLHGANGRGRLAFHRLCASAVWYSYSANGAAKISIDSNTIKDYSGVPIATSELPSPLSEKSTGTLVELLKIHDGVVSAQQLETHFQTEFGWYLAFNAQKKLSINGSEISLPAHTEKKFSHVVDEVMFEGSVVVWHDKPNSEKSYAYVLDSDGKCVGRRLSAFNHKGPFHSSAYVKSDWADNFSPDGPSITHPDAVGFESDVWRKLWKELTRITHELYVNFLSSQFEKEISSYVTDGIFPTYAGLDPQYKVWRFENTKRILRAIYEADPIALGSLNKKQKKLIVRLLDKLAISNENDAIFDVLNSVLELSPEAVETFASQLKRTSLENIVATIEILQKRSDVIDGLRVIMNDHYTDVLETPDLQNIIENNTWLFGHQYETLGAEEDNFTKIAKNLRQKLKSLNDIDEHDLDAEDVVHIAGAKRQTDLFLVRQIPSFDSFGNQIYRCVIIEIKRPSISLNKKHLRQLDDYADIVKDHPDFNSSRMHFELILIGRKISSMDKEIGSRLHNQLSKGQMGLVSEDERMKRYVLNWYTLLDGLKLSNQTMLNALKLKRENLSAVTKDELLTELQVPSK